MNRSTFEAQYVVGGKDGEIADLMGKMAARGESVTLPTSIVVKDTDLESNVFEHSRRSERLTDTRSS